MLWKNGIFLGCSLYFGFTDYRITGNQGYTFVSKGTRSGSGSGGGGGGGGSAGGGDSNCAGDNARKYDYYHKKITSAPLDLQGVEAVKSSCANCCYL